MVKSMGTNLLVTWVPQNAITPVHGIMVSPSWVVIVTPLGKSCVPKGMWSEWKKQNGKVTEAPSEVPMLAPPPGQWVWPLTTPQKTRPPGRIRKRMYGECVNAAPYPSLLKVSGRPRTPRESCENVVSWYPPQSLLVPDLGPQASGSIYPARQRSWYGIRIPSYPESPPPF